MTHSVFNPDSGIASFVSPLLEEEVNKREVNNVKHIGLDVICNSSNSETDPITPFKSSLYREPSQDVMSGLASVL